MTAGPEVARWPGVVLPAVAVWKGEVTTRPDTAAVWDYVLRCPHAELPAGRRVVPLDSGEMLGLPVEHCQRCSTVFLWRAPADGVPS